METKFVTAVAHGDARTATAALASDVERRLGGADPAMLMAFASTKQPLDEVMARLQEAFPSVRLLGTSTAGEFTEEGDVKGGVAVAAVAGDFVVHAGMGTGLKQGLDSAVSQAVSDLPRSLPGYPHRTAIVLLDALSGSSEEATLLVSERMGGDVRLAGGAAGDDLAMKDCRVALGSRTARDAIVVAAIFSRKPLGVGVCHGHRALSRPLRVTKAHGNVVHEIEGRPAWSVWAEATRAAAAEIGSDPNSLKADEVTPYLLRYEAGLATGNELKIRAPLSRNEDGSINFACGIPEGVVIRITESEPERQVGSARIAARRALEQAGGGSIAGAIVFDCICRNLILAADFKRAIAGISEELGNVPLAGFETYGEIALDAGDMSGFHNTTTVVLTFPT